MALAQEIVLGQAVVVEEVHLVVVPSGSCGGTFGTTSRRCRCCGCSYTGWNYGGCCASCSLALVLCSCKYL